VILKFYNIFSLSLSLSLILFIYLFIFFCRKLPWTDKLACLMYWAGKIFPENDEK
jgi:hypothetical protein